LERVVQNIAEKSACVRSCCIKKRSCLFLEIVHYQHRSPCPFLHPLAEVYEEDCAYEEHNSSYKKCCEHYVRLVIIPYPPRGNHSKNRERKNQDILVLE